MELTNITREIIHELGNHPLAKTKWVGTSYLVFKCFYSSGEAIKFLLTIQ